MSDALRVMVIGPTGPDLFVENVHDTLIGLGIDSHCAGSGRLHMGPRRVRNAVHVASRYLESVDRLQQRHLIETAARLRPTLIISVEGQLRPSIVRALREHAREVVLWFPDAVANLGRHELFLAPYTRFFFKNRPLVQQLTDVIGLPARYLPEAANPRWHRPMGEYGSRREILMAGNLHPTRALLLERLITDGYPVAIYGSPAASWIPGRGVRTHHSGEFLVRETKSRAFRGARAVLNNLHPAEFAGANCRLFEATGAGAVVLTEERPGMRELFDFATEVVGFSSYAELTAACDRLLDDGSYGRPIADAAAARTRRDHTYAHRLRLMLDDLGLG